MELSRPIRSKPKPQVIPQLESCTNVAGEVFKPGDRISVLAPWGGKTIAEIELIYKAESGNVWAKYKRAEPGPNEWVEWENGVCRCQLLKGGN